MTLALASPPRARMQYRKRAGGPADRRRSTVTRDRALRMAPAMPKGRPYSENCHAGTFRIEIISMPFESQNPIKGPSAYFAVVDDGHSACGRAARASAQAAIADVTADAGLAPHRDVAAASGFRAVQSEPLVSPPGLPQSSR